MFSDLNNYVGDMVGRYTVEISTEFFSKTSPPSVSAILKAVQSIINLLSEKEVKGNEKFAEVVANINAYGAGKKVLSNMELLTNMLSFFKLAPRDVWLDNGTVMQGLMKRFRLERAHQGIDALIDARIADFHTTRFGFFENRDEVIHGAPPFRSDAKYFFPSFEEGLKACSALLDEKHVHCFCFPDSKGVGLTVAAVSKNKAPLFCQVVGQTTTGLYIHQNPKGEWRGKEYAGDYSILHPVSARVFNKETVEFVKEGMLVGVKNPAFKESDVLALEKRLGFTPREPDPSIWTKADIEKTDQTGQSASSTTPSLSASSSQQ